MSGPTCTDLACGDIERWPNCLVPDCDAKANLWLGRGMCFPHSLGIPRGEWDEAIADGMDWRTSEKRRACLRRYGWAEDEGGGIRPVPPAERP